MDLDYSSAKRSNIMSTIMLTIIFTISIISTLTINPIANTDPIGAGAMLRSGVDARALGMGGAYVAIANNYSAAYWNPAGVTRAEPIYLGGMNMDKFGVGLNLNYISGGLSPGKLSLIEPVSLPGFEESIIEDFSISGTYMGFSTNVRASNPSGNPVGVITYSERTYMGTTGFQLPVLGSVGGSIKLYRFRAPNAGVDGKNAEANGLGFDLGFLTEPLDNFWIAAAGFDLTGTEIKWDNTPSEPTNIAPSRYSAGAAYELNLVNLPIPGAVAGEAIFSGQYTFGANVENKIKTGFEYSLSVVALRGGLVKTIDGALEFAAGAGLKLNILKADVAWVQNKTIEGQNTSDTIVLSTEFSFSL